MHPVIQVDGVNPAYPDASDSVQELGLPEETTKGTIKNGLE